MKIHINDCTNVAKKTTPPKLHTEATLLTAMENAGASIEGGAILKGRGIGTHGAIMTLMMGYFDSSYDLNFRYSTSKPDIYRMEFNEHELLIDALFGCSY